MSDAEMDLSDGGSAAERSDRSSSESGEDRDDRSSDEDDEGGDESDGSSGSSSSSASGPDDDEDEDDENKDRTDAGADAVENHTLYIRNTPLDDVNVSDTNILLPQIAEHLRSNDDEEVLLALRAVRRMLSADKAPPIGEIIALGVVPIFVKLSGRSGNKRLQCEAAWCVTNIASGTEHQTRSVVEAGAIPVLVTMVCSPDDELCEQAIWALGNITGDFRDRVLAAGTMEPTLNALRTRTSKTLVRNAAWLISQMCRSHGDEPHPELSVVAVALPAIAEVLAKHKDPEVLSELAWAVAWTTEGGDPARVQAVIDTGVVKSLVAHVDDRACKVRHAVIRALGNISAGGEAHASAVIKAGAVKPLKKMVTDPKKARGACWIFANMAAGSTRNTLELREAGVLDAAEQILSRSVDYEVRKEALWYVANSFAEAPSYVAEEILAKHSGSIAGMLNGSDVRLCRKALLGIERLCQAGAYLNVNRCATALSKIGVDRQLSVLCDHYDPEFARSAKRVYTRYFAQPQPSPAGVTVAAAAAAAAAPAQSSEAPTAAPQ
eukprot:m51a1_g3320 hypothetical protein (550) ;mRNA; f:352585-354762